MVATVVLAALFGLMVALGSAVRILGAVGNEQLNYFVEDTLVEEMEPFIRDIGSFGQLNGGISVSDDVFQVSVEIDITKLEVEFFDFSGEMTSFHGRFLNIKFP